MIIAVQGCSHGELNSIYKRLDQISLESGLKPEILLCCGDFQPIRDEQDLEELSCPKKYRLFRDFIHYYNGDLVAPILTIFIGGNHEAPHFLKNLYFGGWVAPNIYYLGHSGIINVNGLRIGGLSGIYKHQDYKLGYFEKRPYDEFTKRSSYHIREFEVEKLLLIKEPLDIFISHDWPLNIVNYGDYESLIKKKPFFESQIRVGDFGNPATEIILKHLKPSHWFSAHMHVRYSALYTHDNGKTTSFLALDKVLPGRKYIEVIDIPITESNSNKHFKNSQNPIICYDLEWCAINYVNHSKMPLHSFVVSTPLKLEYPTESEISKVKELLSKKCKPLNYFYQILHNDSDAYKSPKKQQQDFLNLLELSTNSYFDEDDKRLEIKFIDSYC